MLEPASNPIDSFSSHPGTYALLLHLPTPRKIEVGKLGRYYFPAGFYIYVGSALGSGGLAGRLGRHLKPTAFPGWKAKWHIDYLHHYAKIAEVWTIKQTVRREHDWASLVQELPGAAVPMPGFGSSDCSCLTHLFHFSHLPRHDDFRSMLARGYPEDDLVVVDMRFGRL
jgi:Uri superfamily endonuclease